jgi:exodeoxyribonuclease-3
MAFRKKAKFILAHQPDIPIVPECEHPDKLKFSAGTAIPTDILWYGDNQNKGLGIFSYGKCKFRLLGAHNVDLKNILPIAVTEGPIDFTLFAIWAYNPLDKDYNYIGQVWKSIHHYEKILKGKNIILAGDFNSNVIWDKLHRKSSHSMVVEKLKSLRIFSTYHAYFNCVPGMETHPTFFLYRDQNKPYHIDYCFASAGLIKKLGQVEIGPFEDWSQHSDHNPLIVSFKI